MVQIASVGLLAFICLGLFSSRAFLVKTVFLILSLYCIFLLISVENPKWINQIKIVPQPVFSKSIDVF